MKRRRLILSVSLLFTACATAPPASMFGAGAEVDVSGRWLGTWRAPSSGDPIIRQDMLNAEFVQDGHVGRGKIVWSGANTSGLPEDVILAGALGVPVVLRVSGSVVDVKHAFTGHPVAARLEMRSADEMVGRMVGTDRPVELVLVRQGPENRATAGAPRAAAATPANTERVERLETELAQERARLTSMVAQVNDLRARADAANRAADAAVAVAQRVALAAETAKSSEPVAPSAPGAVSATAGEPLAAAVATQPRHERRQLKLIDVGFRFNKFELDDVAETALLDIVDMLKQDVTLMADLEGYTDSVGGVGYNVQLSQRRVESVQRFLAKKGVPLSQMHFVGFGPVRDDGSTEEQARNRRVTVRVMGDEPSRTSAIQPSAPDVSVPTVFTPAPMPAPVSVAPIAPAPATADTPAAQTTAGAPMPQATPEPSATVMPQPVAPETTRPATSANETPATDQSSTPSGSTK